MYEKAWKWVGLAAMCLMVLVSAFVAVRWISQLSFWCKIDSGWTQAIGGIVAIVAAFIVGERQSNTALKAIHHAAELERTRARESILAITDAAKGFAHGTKGIVFPSGFDSEKLEREHLDTRHQHVVDALGAIPLHEIGSFDAVIAIIDMKAALAGFKDELDPILDKHTAEAFYIREGAPVFVQFNGRPLRDWCDLIIEKAHDTHAALND